ncbi:MAG: hypothetical protein K2X98_01410 [Alphaproteobacteria bacterium]|nr:hypothetical protein [Alphaproteobacteria bacterium]
MSDISTANPLSLLTSAVTALNTKNKNVADNMANAGVRGALRKDQAITSLGAAGVIAADRTVFLDPELVRSLQKSNGNEAYWNQVSSTYSDFMKNFGTKEALHSLDTMCQSMRSEILKLNTDMSANQKLTLLQDIQSQLVKFSEIQKSVTNMRLDIDIRKNQLVTSDIPELLQAAAKLNRSDQTAESIETLNKIKFDLSQRIGDLTFEQGKGVESAFFTVKVGNIKLLEKQTTAFLSYTPTSNPAPGVGLNPVMVNGQAIDTNISSGELAGLNTADSALVKIQGALDNFGVHLRDMMNQIHNQGTGTQQPSTLQGIVGYFGTEGTPINTNDVVSGTGTLRIALLDNTNSNHVVDYIDVALQQNETLSSLFNRINTAPYALGSGSTLTISVDPVTGAPRIVSNNATNPPVTLGISIGHAGAAQAMLSAGANFAANAATNFSHFFHFNDLITSGSTTNTAGIFGNMSIRPDLIQSPDRLSGCDLDYGALTAISYGVVDRPPPDRNMFDKLYASFSQGRSFAAVGDMGPMTTTLLNYGTNIIDYYATLKKSSESDFKDSTAALQNYQQLFDKQSGIDPEAEKLKGIEVARSLNAAMSIMRSILRLDEKALELLNI